MEGRELDYSRRRLSSSSEDRTLFYIEDLSGTGRGELPSPGSDTSQQRPQRPRSQTSRRNSYTQCGGPISTAGNGSSRPRRQRRPSEFADTSARRSSNAQHHRSRANSYTRPTPLGDGRRASVCKRKSVSGSSGRLASSGGRRASIAATGHQRRASSSRSPSALLAPADLSLEAIKDPRELARARRHRLVAIVLLVTFIFILLAAVLAVVITLTHSSFHVPPIGSRELAEHRANDDGAGVNNATPSARRTKSY